MRVRHVVALLIALVLLVGCDSGEGTTSGTRYDLKLAPGWGEATKQTEADATKQVAGEASKLGVRSGLRLDLLIGKTDSSGTTVNVIREKAPGGATLEGLGELFRGQLKSIGASNITDARSAAIDGDDAITYKYGGTSRGGKAFRGRQVLVLHGGHALTISLTARVARFHSANQDFSSMLRSWHWK
jgi:hypothetical protein